MSHSPRNVILGSFLLILMLAGVGFLFHRGTQQSIITTITIEQIEWDNEGKARVTYRIRAPKGMAIQTEFRVNGRCWAGGTERSFRPTWSFSNHVNWVRTDTFDLKPERSRETGSLRKRLLVELGKDYSVSPEKRFYFFDFQSSEGDHHQHFIEVRSWQ